MEQRTVEERLASIERRLDRLEGLMSFIGEQLVLGARTGSGQPGRT